MLVSRFAGLQRTCTDYALRRTVLNSRITLIDVIADSVEPPLDDEALKLLGLLNARKADAYSRLANWDIVTDFFDSLQEMTLSDLEARLFS
jgi:hypothetical protein